MSTKLKFPLAVLITGEDAGLDRALGNVNLKLRAIGQLGTSVGRGLTLGLSAPLGLAGVAALRMGIAVQSSMLQVRAAKNLTAEQTEALHQNALSYADMGVGVDDAAHAMVSYAKAGLGLNEIMAIMRPTILLAKSAFLETTDVSEPLVRMIIGTRQEFGKTANIVDKLVYATDSYTLNLLELFEAFKLSGPTAAGLNQDFETTLTLLSMLAQGGFPGTRGDTALRDMLANLSEFSRGHVTKHQAEVLSNYGLKPTELRKSTGELKNMIDLLAEIEKRAKAPTIGGDLMALFGQRGGPGALALIGQTTAAMRKFREELGNVSGVAQSKYDTVMSGAAGTTSRFKANLENLADKFANSGLIDDFTYLTNKASGLVHWFDEMTPARKRFAVNAGLIAFAIGAIATAIFRTITLITQFKAALLTLEAAKLAAATSAGGAAGAGGLAAAGAGKFATAMKFIGPAATIGAVVGTDVFENLGKHLEQTSLGLYRKWDLEKGTNNAETFAKSHNIKVDFSNVPAGTKITSDSDQIQLDVGYAMPGSGK